MSCGYDEDLTAFVDGELAPDRQAAVAAHLTACVRCRESESRIRKSVQLLAALPVRVDVDAAAARRAVWARLDAPVPATRWQRLVATVRRPMVLGPILAGATVAVVLVVTRPAGIPVGIENAPPDLELLSDLELLEHYDVLDLERVEDFEVVASLNELEVR